MEGHLVDAALGLLEVHLVRVCVGLEALWHRGTEAGVEIEVAEGGGVTIVAGTG